MSRSDYFSSPLSGGLLIETLQLLIAKFCNPVYAVKTFGVCWPNAPCIFQWRFCGYAGKGNEIQASHNIATCT